MGKYSQVQVDIFSIFNSSSWKAENIKTLPQNFIAMNSGNEFLRINIIPAGAGINVRSVSGIIIVDIFTPAGTGPKRSLLIADKLDSYLQGKSIPSEKGNTQFQSSSFRTIGVDKDNPSLFRSNYEIPFN
jgi:hypothetical protein